MSTTPTINSVGDIGNAQINGTMQQSSIVCNMTAGGDGIFGTIDDMVVNPSATGQINLVEVNGSLGIDCPRTICSWPAERSAQSDGRHRRPHAGHAPADLGKGGVRLHSS